MAFGRIKLRSVAMKAATKGGKGVAAKQVGIYENIARWVARGIQLIFALIVAGLYGHRVDTDRKAGNPQSAAWVYAVLIAGLSCVTCIVYSIPMIKFHRLFAWDLSLFVLWIAVFGTFARIFLKQKFGGEYEGTSVTTMKLAVWIDLVNCILWLLTGVYGCFRTFVGKKINNTVDKVEMGINGKIDDGFNSIKGKAGFA